MLAMELTERRLQICQFIAQFVATHRYAPTIREIGHGMGISSTSVVLYHLRALERAGALCHREGYSRTIVLIPGWFDAHQRKASGHTNHLAGAACHAE
jgi:repressor LexA